MPSHVRRFAGWYIAFFLTDFVPIYPLYAVMFGEHGVGPYELSVLFTVWIGVCLVCEVPSGALADRVSRKRLLVVSNLFQTCAYLAWMLFQSFSGYLIGFVLWGLAEALASGTKESLLFDTLAASGDSDLFAKVYGRINALGSLACALSMLLGGLLIQFGYGTVLVLSLVFPMLAGFVVAVAISDAPRTGHGHESGYFSTLWQGLREAATNPTILFVVAISSTLLALPDELEEFIGPLLHEKGVTKEWIGYLTGAIFVSQAFGNAVAHRFRRVTLSRLFAMLFIAGGVLGLVALQQSAYIVIGLMLYFLLFSFVQPLFAARLQEAIQSSARATVTSISGAAGGIATIVIIQSFGLVASRSSMSGGTLFMAVLGLVLCLIFSVAAYRLRETVGN